MTLDLFRQDAYRTECTATVRALTPEGVVLDQTVFYPLGGGQAGDSGVLIAPGGLELTVADTRKAKDADGRFTDEIWHVPAPNAATALWNSQQPALRVGDVVTARIDWPRRHRLMRLHTACHLLCHVVARPVDGCSITAEGARLDFHTTEPLDKTALTQALAALVAQAHPVHVGAVTDAELDANPQLVKSMSVQPPRGTGRVRTIGIGAANAIDLQPCGGTHVANTAEVGAVVVAKIEKKSAHTRRVVLALEGA